MDRLDEAEASFTQAILFKPNFTETHAKLGATLQKVGRYEDAEASHNQAIALNSSYVEAHSNLGAKLQRLGKIEKLKLAMR